MNEKMHVRLLQRDPEFSMQFTFSCKYPFLDCLFIVAAKLELVSKNFFLGI